MGAVPDLPPCCTVINLTFDTPQITFLLFLYTVFLTVCPLTWAFCRARPPSDMVLHTDVPPGYD